MSRESLKTEVAKLREELRRAEEAREEFARLYHQQKKEERTRASVDDRRKATLDKLLRIHDDPETFLPRAFECTGHLYDHYGHVRKLLADCADVPRHMLSSDCVAAFGALSDHAMDCRDLLGDERLASLNEFEELRAKFQGVDIEAQLRLAQEASRLLQRRFDPKIFRLFRVSPTLPLGLYYKFSAFTRNAFVAVPLGLYALVEASFLRGNSEPLKTFALLYGSQVLAYLTTRFFDRVFVEAMLLSLRGGPFNDGELRQLLAEVWTPADGGLTPHSLSAFRSSVLSNQESSQKHWALELEEIPKIVARVRAGSLLRKAPVDAHVERLKLAGGS